MDKKSVTAIITFLKDEFKQKGVELRGIALFGSQLTGTAYSGSDIDLIIVSDTFQNKNIFERSDITMEVEIKALKEFHLPMDILKMTMEEFNQSIQNKRFYAKLV